MSLMEEFIVLLLFIVVIGLLNEKIFHLQSDISLLLITLIISILMSGIGKFHLWPAYDNFVQELGDIEFERYLLDCVLCFMLFAGASKVNMGKFRQNLKTISLLALLTTVLSSFFYGGILYGITALVGIDISFWTCVMLGCIVSPTDPIAATGILNKLGLSKNVTSVIESESLFNDGTGVALFVFVRSIVANSGKSNFAVVMAKEVIGAFAVALAVSFVLGKCMELTVHPVRQIFISILNVAMVYAVCEHFGFSGVIASVVCGMYFANVMDKLARRRAVYDPHNLYVDFWEVMDNIFNAILFVMIGISVINVNVSKYFLLLIPIGIVAVVLSRFMGVAVSTVLVGSRKIPSSYSFLEFVSLMTWSALKGGLSLALAIGTAEFLSREVYLIVLNVTYITIFFTVVVQGLTVSGGYRMIERHKAKRIQKNSLRNARESK